MAIQRRPCPVVRTECNVRQSWHLRCDSQYLGLLRRNLLTVLSCPQKRQRISIGILLVLGMAHGIEQVPNLATHARIITSPSGYGPGTSVKTHEVGWHPGMAEETLSESVEVACCVVIPKANLAKQGFGPQKVVVWQANIPGLFVFQQVFTGAVDCQFTYTFSQQFLPGGLRVQGP